MILKVRFSLGALTTIACIRSGKIRRVGREMDSQFRRELILANDTLSVCMPGTIQKTTLRESPTAEHAGVLIG